MAQDLLGVVVRVWEEVVGVVAAAVGVEWGVTALGLALVATVFAPIAGPSYPIKWEHLAII